MCEPSESSQLKSWLFSSPESLDLCRARANREGRKWISNLTSSSDYTAPVSEETKLTHVTCFARNFNPDSYKDEDDGPWQSPTNQCPYLNPSEEALLVSFYVSKLPNLIGPQAQIPRLRRESKIPATAALLLRRFFLSNSVMVYDPKTVMVASAFLAAKVEDAMTDIRYLEDGTNQMNAPVSQSEIIPGEIALLSGIHFDLLCFHPYKAVLAITEDLRTYLKSAQGRALVKWTKNPNDDRAIVGQDLKPMHDAAQKIVNDVIVSDIPLLYTPGQVGLAALMVANEEQMTKIMSSSSSETTKGVTDIPQIDIMGYLTQRFQDQQSPESLEQMKIELREICTSLRQLAEGKYGCGNHQEDLSTLKDINKKLKKVRVWGIKESKKKKKRKNENKGDNTESESKKAKTS